MRSGIVLAAAMAIGCGFHALAGETLADRKIQELGASAPGQKMEEVYARALDGLVPALGGDDLRVRGEAQETLENMANNAAAPGREGQRAALCRAMAARIGPQTAFEARYWLIREMETVGKGEVVEALAGQLGDRDPQIRERVVCALEANRSTQAAEALARWRAASMRYPDNGEHSPAALGPVASLRNLVSKGDPSAGDALAEALLSDDAKLQVHAARMAGELGADVSAKLIRVTWDKIPAAAKAVLVYAVAEHSGPEARAIVLDAALGHDGNVRLAGIEGLGKVGDAAAVPVLLRAAVEETGPIQASARQSLERLEGSGVDHALVEELKTAPASERSEIVRALGGRRWPEALPALLELAKTDPDHDVRVQAMDALGSVGGPEQLQALIGLMGANGSDEDAKAAEAAVGAIVYRIRGADQRAEPLLRALETAPGAKLALIRLLGRTGGGKALEVLRQSVHDADREVRLAAVRGMSEWPDDRVAGDLLEFARAANDLTEKVLALRGYLRALSIPNERSEEESVKLYAAALPLARVEEKKAILGGLGNHPTVEALKIVAPMLDEKDVQNEAINAAVKIARGVGKQDVALVRTAMHKVENLAELERTRQSAREILKGLDEP